MNTNQSGFTGTSAAVEGRDVRLSLCCDDPVIEEGDKEKITFMFIPNVVTKMHISTTLCS